jgi:chemotaxis signal transduction protein
VTTTLVRFRAATGDYAVPVERAVQVREATGLAHLPGRRPGVAGIVRRDEEVLTVLETLGPGADHILVLDAGQRRFGLHVEAVVGLVRVPADALGAPPAGQEGRFVAGSVVLPDYTLVLVVDVDALAAELDR